MAVTPRTRRRAPAAAPAIEEAPHPSALERWEVIAYIALVLTALIFRLWNLGSQALHHDESMHAYYSYVLYRGGGFAHNPLLHGTFLFIGNAFIYLIFGATDATARLLPALAGAAVVGMPFFLRNQLGRWGALITAVFLAFSPAFLYFSRFIRQDIYTPFFVIGMVICLFRYMEEKKSGYLYGLAALLALSFTNKEDTYFSAIILAAFLSMVVGAEALRGWGTQALLTPTAVAWGWAVGIWRVVRKGPAELSPASNLLIVLGTLLLPQLAGFAFYLTKTTGARAPDDGQMTIVYLALLGLSAMIGLRWNPKLWLGIAVVFNAIFLTLFTTFFSNPDGFASGAWGGLRYWVEQQGVQRGAQPWFYYFLLLPLYEFLPLIFALAGGVFYALRRDLFGRFLIFWLIGAVALYTWAGEKMPWLLVPVATPFLLLGGKFLGHLIESADWRSLRRPESLMLGGAIILAITIGLGFAGLGIGPKPTPLQAQSMVLQRTFMALLLIGALTTAVYLGWRLRWAVASRVIALTAVVILGSLSFRAATQLAYFHSDIPVEMAVYTQSSPDVTAVMEDIERIAFRTGQGLDLKVAYDSDSSWPFEWYLREYRNRNFYATGAPAADAPVVLVGFETGRQDQMKAALGDRYVGQRYRLRWWFPEEVYRSLTWQTVLSTPFNPELRDKLWRYWIYRETAPLGSTDFMFYVRKDLVGGAWMPAAQTLQAAPAEDVYAQKARVVTSSLTFGQMGSGPGQLNEPKGIAVGPDGSIYVTEGKNNRVQQFDSRGNAVRAWGSPGDGPGQFNEPWGIAVDQQGNVYVADTWNHRIQKFDRNGNFLTAWGQLGDARGAAPGPPNVFYGPRAVAIDGAGNVLVTDTGNKRIMRFDSQGNFLGQFGGGLQLNEPVGVAVDRQGMIYVADTWNHRVLKLDANFNVVGQWDVRGWAGESVVNKPYLTVDRDGYVYATDPERHRVITFDAAGQLVAVFGKQGSDSGSFNLPVGVALDAESNLLVADGLNHRVMKFAPIR